MNRHGGELRGHLPEEGLESPQLSGFPHEAGSYLTVIEGFAEMLVEGLGPIPVETARHFAGIIARDAGRFRESLRAGGRSLESDGVAEEEHGETAAPWPVMSAYGRPRVEVADDDSDVRSLVRIHLEARDWVVGHAVYVAKRVGRRARSDPGHPELDGGPSCAGLTAVAGT